MPNMPVASGREIVLHIHVSKVVTVCGATVARYVSTKIGMTFTILAKQTVARA